MKIWDIKGSKAIRIHKKIMNMIAMDNQPYSIVEDQGFIELLAELEPRYVIPSTKYFNETMLLQSYGILKQKITKELSNASSLRYVKKFEDK